MLFLLVPLVSLFLLSVLSGILTGYPNRPSLSDPQTTRRTIRDREEEQAVLLFKVSPVKPKLYWSIMTADYYTGRNWLRTTNETLLKEFPQFQDDNATAVFTVEYNTSLREFFLPMAPFNSTLANISRSSAESLKLYVDALGNSYKVIKHGQAKEIVYTVSWRDVELDDKLISLDNISEEISNKYLQLPNVPSEVWKLAKDLEKPSYSALDQILADVQFLRTNFVYDHEHSHESHGRIVAYGVEYPKYPYDPIIQGSNIYSFLRERRGICIDAATLLAVILRIQEIPARISLGYKPERIHEGKLLYYTSGAHAVTEVYLPPYGWIQFDATPPLEEVPLVKVLPIKKEASPGSKIFYQLSITNRRNFTDNFKLLINSKQKWNVEAVPEELRIEAFQTVDALLEVTLPENASLGEKDIMTVTVTSLSYPVVAFSVWTIVQAKNIIHIPTLTTIQGIDKAVIRGDTLWVNGTVLTANDEPVDNMTIYLFLTKDTEAKGLVVGKGYSRQGNFQIESRVPSFADIGDYKVIAISLGTEEYAFSSSDFIIKILATTKIELGSEEKFLLQYGAIHGSLLLDNGTGLAGASVSLRITPLATPSEVLEFQNLTSKDGSFRIATRFETSGVHEIKAFFSGNEYLLESEETRVVELKRGVPTIQISSENIAVRGEVYNITGTILFEDTGVWGEPVTVTFDNQLLGTIETRDNGSYTLPFLVNPEEKLGVHIIAMSLREGNLTTVHKVMVKSKTTLTVKISEVAEGMFLLVSASLSNDHNMPIQGAEIVLDNYGLSGKTDETGNLTLILDTIKLWPENLALSTRFEGSKTYLPSTTENEVVLQPITSLPFLIPLVSPTLVVMAFAYTRHLIRKRQALQQLSDMEDVKARAVAGEPTYEPPKRQPLKIVLPDIKAPLPNVWGVKDKLRMEIVLDKGILKKTQKRMVEVLINEETVASVGLSQQGRAELSYIFLRKGEHKVRAFLPRTSRRRPLNAEIKVRVVDYREEIIRLYNEFLEKLVEHGIRPRNEMTAQEIESLILRMNDFSSAALRKVTTCFEKAEYSNHPLTREDYEAMYLSLKELNIDVE